jgi:hypothetical protein
MFSRALWCGAALGAAVSLILVAGPSVMSAPPAAAAPAKLTPAAPPDARAAPAKPAVARPRAVGEAAVGRDAEVPAKPAAGPAAGREPIPAEAWTECASLAWPSPAERRIEDALKSPTSIEFVETPLHDLVDYLKDLHHIEIQLEEKGLADVNVGPDTQITKNLKGISLRSALNQLLGDLGLDYAVQNEVLWITSPKRLDAHPTTKLYYVADLVARLDKHNRPYDDYDTLIGLITSTVAPATWGPAHGPGSIKGATVGGAKVLSVRATYPVHHELADVLANLRSIAIKSGRLEPPRRDAPTPP